MADISTLAPPEGGAAGNGHVRGRPRTLRRQRSLPSGRAVAGGLLVAIAAIGIFWAYTRFSEGPRHAYVVLRNPVRVGARIKAADLQLQKMDLPVSLQRQAFDAPGQLVGTTAIAPLVAGQLVQQGDVEKVGSGRAREVTFTVDRAHTSGVVAAGEYVDVIATYGAGEQTKSQMVMRHVLVIGFAGNRGTFTDGAYQVSVAVESEADALKLTAATQGAKVSLLRSSGALDGAGASAGP
jgi:Flp pilus assembly protein CpaB